MARDRKPQTQDKDLYRVNENIRIPDVRLVGENLDELSEVAGQPLEPGVYSTRLLLEWARKSGLDLVEISPNAKPPVVKIIDFQKFLYDKKKRERELKAKTVKTVVKEIRFGPNTDDHDFEFKVKHARNFLGEGSKVKAYVHFRGRSIVFKDRGELLLLRFMKELEDVGSAESLPVLEGKRMNVLLAPRKSQKTITK